MEKYKGGGLREATAAGAGITFAEGDAGAGLAEGALVAGGVGDDSPRAVLLPDAGAGSQHTDGEYQQLLKDWQIEASMNGVSTWYDNAPVESFFATLKTERVHHHIYCTRDDARADIFYYIEAFYNRRRVHSSLGNISPMSYDKLYHHQASSA